MSGFVDLHCHLIPGVDDGARTLDDALEMARALVDLGFQTVAPSPHARPEYAPPEVVADKLAELRAALDAARIPLTLGQNAENFLDEDFVRALGTPRARMLGAGRHVLVEVPYTSPVPALPDVLFRIRTRGVTPVIAHPERCLEFERKGRAAEVVRAGALLQLDVGALTGRYGPQARKLARAFLDEGLYSVGATDLHSPVGAREWVGAALAELRGRAGEQAVVQLMREHPARLLAGESLESGGE
ncbi:protein tyrosine phosphatase [Corallococcus sp. H22C18031201]|uniref:tyrosine-protein phosphatase n=1 Tax=Citreicoccus inhibens TaxID=2849499 RepID=UPI000E734E89|nr:CpsB/CapC family capsule biosynthesis tyrosine phosphatase [Citreicoccus inhibens]MBU8897813.1 protein tyrosine phosphatase [Citreicoccus inhibens]RJS24921.1 protein tyrosine phosphatase [Corallococcus sp. H22C18031201]